MKDIVATADVEKKKKPVKNDVKAASEMFSKLPRDAQDQIICLIKSLLLKK